MSDEAHDTALDLGRVAALDARGRGSKPALLEYLATSLGWPEVSLDDRLERFRAGVLRHVSIEPGVQDMLVRLRSSFQLGLVSNGTRASQRRKIAVLGLDS